MVAGSCPVGVAEEDQDNARRLRFGIWLTAFVCLGQLAGGIWTGSLALLSDAAHQFSDVLALSLSLLAIGLACRPPTGRHSYGLHRTEVLAALVNGLSLLVICGLILWEAYVRLLAPQPIKSGPMLIVATLGLIANWLVTARIGHGHHDLNLRAAYLHNLGDVFASASVMVGAAVIHFTGWTVVDPILSALISVLIVVGALSVVSEGLHILLEGTPRGIDLDAVVAAMTELPEVEAVHHIHAWSICSNVLAFSGHVVTCPESEEARLATRRKLAEILSDRFGFCDATLEFECDPCADDDLFCKIEHGMTDAHDHHHHEHDHDHVH